MQRRERFAQIVLEHQARLRSFVRMLGIAPEAVDDIAQDTFVIAYERWDTLDEIDNAGKWLRGIARNLVRNELRKLARRKQVVSAAMTEALLEVQDDELHGIDNPAWLAALEQCVALLPQNSRDIVRHRYQLDANSNDLGEQFGMTAEAVRQTLLRIRRRLRDCLEQRMGGILE